MTILTMLGNLVLKSRSKYRLSTAAALETSAEIFLFQKYRCFGVETKNSAEVNTDFLNGLPPYDLEIEIMAEVDELWSYVDSKQNQRWRWYAVERKSGMILAWHNGRRTDESCSCLIEKLSVFPVARYHTNDWKSYRKYIHFSKHVIGKADTWQIERRNLNFRTHIKRLGRRTSNKLFSFFHFSLDTKKVFFLSVTPRNFNISLIA